MFTILVGGLSWAAVAQNVALKTNLLYWSTVTPNLGLEASIARKHTVQLFYGLNPWEPSGGKSLKHWVVQTEYRYWFMTTSGTTSSSAASAARSSSLPMPIISGLPSWR